MCSSATFPATTSSACTPPSPLPDPAEVKEIKLIPRYLIVANQTLNSSHLRKAVTTLVGRGPAHLHLLVPATPAKDQLTWTEGEARSIAQRRLDQALAVYGSLPATVAGQVGDANPLLAVRDQLDAGQHFDLIVVSTLPPGLSRWLRQDLARRIRKSCALPVQHVVAPAPAVAPAS